MRRSLKFVVLVSGAIAVAGFLLAEGLFLLLARASALIPSQGPTSRVNPHGEEVYAALNQPPVPIESADITRVELRPDAGIQVLDPFSQLIALGQMPRMRWIGLALVVVLVALVLVNAFTRLNRRPQLTFIALASWTALTAAFAIFLYATRGARGTWDEIYVFASQARNFAEYGLAAVPTTGPRGIAESSADLGITIMGGLVMKALPTATGETALVIGFSILIAALTLAASLALRYWFSFGRVLSLLVPLALIGLLPQAVLASAQAVPTGVAAGAFAVFGLVLFHSMRTGNVVAFAAYSIPFAIIRWEYGIVAAFSALVLIGVQLWRVRGGAVPWPAWRYVVVLAPWGFFLIETAYRLIVFGSWAPSGVLAKSMGIDGAYIQSGLEYLSITSATNLWPLMLSLAIATTVLARGYRQSRVYLVVVAIALLPILNSVIAGGDWFPREWERYVLPSYAAVLIVTFASFGEALAKKERKRMALIPVAVTYLLTQSLLVSIMYTDYVGPELPGRTNCLARAGLAIARVVPPAEGIASAEVNTVAYFARAPVTDLIGLIDPRVANAPPSPMTRGDLLHRKTVPENIYADRPGAIYLYEGADCSGTAISAIEDTERWDALLNFTITQYRTGNLDRLLSAYQPVTISVDNFRVRVLVRNDLIPRI
jgi:hypothetical protein